MTEIIAAIEAAWDADVTLNAIPNPYLELMPEAATYPNADYTYVQGAPPAYHFGRTIIEKTDLMFRVRDTTLASVYTYSRSLDNLLNNPTTKLATESPVAVMSQMSRHAPFVRTLPPESPAGNTIYEAVHTYRFETHRDLP